MAKLLLSNNIEANQDSEDAMTDEDHAENYKGVFFGEDTEQKYYEAGAHFPFKGLCKILESIIKTLSPSRRARSLYGDENVQEEKISCKIFLIFLDKIVKPEEKITKIDNKKDKEKDKLGSRNVKQNNLIPNNSLNNNNLSFLNKLNGKASSKPSPHLITRKILPKCLVN